MGRPSESLFAARFAHAALVLVAACRADEPPPRPAETPERSVCEIEGWTARPRITEGRFGPLRGDLADDFTVPTTDGDWTWSEHFSGCESLVFVPDSLVVSPLDPTPLLESRADLKTLLRDGPANVHYFFVTADGGPARAEAFAEDMADRVEAGLGGLGGAAREAWAPRLHVIDVPLDDLEGWLPDALTAGSPGLVIDRFQRLREIGNLADVNRFDRALEAAGAWPWNANLAYLAHEVRYDNALSDREDELAAHTWTPIYLFHEENIAGNGRSIAEVELPAPDVMATFDTLLVDLTHACDPTRAEFGNCDAWDAIETLYLCDDPADENACRTEIARYITTYHREGRWLADASQLLPLLEGGRTRFQLAGTRGGHFNSLRLLLGKTRDDGLVPYRTVPLWAGGGWTETYDAEHPPIAIDVPADAAEVILTVLVTGHGGESDDNCAEFCDHRHTFAVGGSRYTAEHPQMGDVEGCLKQIDAGTVPNQHGTWWYERSSWCPGKQVDPWVFDVSRDVEPGSAATLSYTTNWGDGVDGGSIVLQSWVTFWR